MARAEQRARSVLQEHHIRKPPVPVEEIAKKLGARVVGHKADAGDDVSGMLYRDGTHTIIGVNLRHHLHRRRFTIAHEIGHLELHPGRAVILDKVRVNLRNRVSSEATDRQEIEANQFAAELLMPRALIEAGIDGILSENDDVSEKDLVKTLATTFEVSAEAMAYRLTNLGILPSPPALDSPQS